MPRTYTRKTHQGLTPPNIMKRAVQAVKDGTSVRDAAKMFEVAKSTLCRYVGKTTQSPDARLQPNYQHKLIFSEAQEKVLSDYIITCSNMFYGLSTIEARTIAYEMALQNDIKFPVSWNNNKMAGKEWLYHFRQRHPKLSLRTPEATSLARASVEKTNASAFTIYNLDESGCTTTQRPPKVIAPKEKKTGGANYLSRAWGIGDYMWCCRS